MSVNILGLLNYTLYGKNFVHASLHLNASIWTLASGAQKVKGWQPTVKSNFCAFNETLETPETYIFHAGKQSLCKGNARANFLCESKENYFKY